MTEKLFVAKSGKNFSEWLPLCVHLNDTAEIMKHLLEEFVSDSFSFSCGLDKSELYKTALFVVGVHDIGKATVAFQFKISHSVPERFKALEHYIKMPDFMDSARMRITPHALAGEIILRYFGCPAGIATIVGAHHGIPSDIDDICKQNLSKEDKKNIVGFENYFGNDEKYREIFKSVWKSFIDEALEFSGLTSLNELPELNSHAQMILCGLLIMADWIASNVNLFPLISVDDNEENINYSERSETAWEKLDFPDMWKSMRKEYSNTEFKNVFGFVPNDIQKALIEIVENSEKSGIYILEAPMGCGKTEASLSSAEVLAGKFDKNGLFFGLPTQATANGLFPRIQQWSEKQSETDRHSIQLKHSSASLNEAFQHIKNGIPDEENDSGLIVHSWFCGNKKACLADFVVATVDQMLMSALKRKHVMLLHLGLSEKIVIIDEVHAYDAYMNRYLERALQWLGSYHTPVILLSATLPAKRRISLIRSYLGTKKSDKKFEENISYPVITWTDGKKICQKNLTYNGKSNSVKIKKCSTDSIFPDIINVVKNGGCVGIIVNTVKRAQHIAETIRNSITENVLLYHAQYIMPDRTLKEEELLRKTGKNSTSETRKGFVAVGTQVLEQSLDIDFDMHSNDVYVCFKNRDELSESDWKMMRKDIFFDMIQPSPIIKVSDIEDFKRLFYDIIEIFRYKPPLHQITLKARMIELLSLIIHDNFPGFFASSANHADFDIQIVKNYIDFNYRNSLSLETLSNQFNYNKYYILRRFKECYGVTPIQYYNNLRLTEAKLLLESHSVTEVADILMFSSIYTFSRAFKAKYHVSPVQYHKNQP